RVPGGRWNRFRRRVYPLPDFGPCDRPSIPDTGTPGQQGPPQQGPCRMASLSDWKVPASAQPKLEDYAYDLEAALSAVVGVRAVVPADAFTADTLGTERAGNGVLIRADGLVLTIGYLITEAETIWLTLVDGRAVPGTVLAYDQTTGFGLIQALARLDLPALPIGQSSAVSVGERVVVGGAGGRQKSVAARVVAKQEFAG